MKFLGAILGFVMRTTVAADETVKRIPVLTAERFQRRPRFRLRARAGVYHDGPVGRGKIVTFRWHPGFVRGAGVRLRH